MNSHAEMIATGVTEWVATIEPTGAGERVFAWKLEPSHKPTELLLADSPQPRCVGARDVTALALSGWMGMTGFNRDAGFRLRPLTGFDGNGDIPVSSPSGQPLLDLYATGEVNGFAGGGQPGYRARQGRPRGSYSVFGRTVGGAVVGYGA